MQTGKNDIIIFLLVTTIIILLLTGLIIMLIYLYKKKQLSYQQTVDALKLDHEKNLMAAQLEMQEGTFQHVSREIHDNISLSLTLAKLHLNTLDLAQREQAGFQVNSSIELISKSINNLSGISKSLNSDIIGSQGLIRALENEIQRIRETGLFTIEFRVTGEPVYMDSKKELIIFRIVQEAFNNIIRHARASSCNVLLHYDSIALRISIADNGVGFDLLTESKASENNKAGLKNMRTRTKMIGGDMEIESRIGQGSILKFTIPF